MGCGSSVEFVVSNFPGQDETAMEVLTKLGLSQNDINKFYISFRKIDKDNSGFVQSTEIFLYFNLSNSSLDIKIFRLFDEDNSGELNFMEFVCSMWHFLSMKETDMGYLLFMLHDANGEGTIALPQIKSLVETLHGKKIENHGTISAIIKRLETSDKFKGTMDSHEFRAWINENIFLVNPLIVLRLSFRKVLFGEKYWNEKLSERYEDKVLSSPTYFRSLQAKVKAEHDRNKEQKELLNAMKASNERRGRGKGGDQRSLLARNNSMLMTTLNVRRSSILEGENDKRSKKSPNAVSPAPAGNANEKETKSLAKKKSSTPNSPNRPPNSVVPTNENAPKKKK